jgi:hypothetical protein
MDQSGSFRIHLSGWGKNKKSKVGDNWDTNKKHLTPQINQIRKQYNITINPSISSSYGQDFIGTHKDDHLFIIANADGHGGTQPHCKEGTLFAFYSVLFSIAEIYKHIDEIKKIYTDNNRLSDYMNHIFQGLDNFLMYDFPETKGFITGGSTLTVNLKFYSRGKMVSITTNAGDTILAGFRNNQIEEKTMQLNCDTLESYQKYIDKCNTIGIKPLEIFLNRFNYKRGYRIDWAGTDGGPIKPFILNTQNNKYTVTENHNTMQKFYDDAPLHFKHNYLYNGGIQSIRDKKTNIEKMKQGKYPCTNFGNTAEGICQCLPGSAIGDITQKHGKHNLMITHTKIEYFKKKNIEIIGSDGFFDVMTDECITEILSELEDPSSNTTLDAIKLKFVDKMFSEIKKHNFPDNWDDISFCIIDTTLKKNKPINKFLQKRQSQKKRKRLNKYNK